SMNQRTFIGLSFMALATWLPGRGTPRCSRDAVAPARWRKQCSGREMTGRIMPPSDLLPAWLLDLTFGHGFGTTRVEAAAGGGLRRLGTSPLSRMRAFVTPGWAEGTAESKACGVALQIKWRCLGSWPLFVRPSVAVCPSLPLLKPKDDML